MVLTIFYCIYKLYASNFNNFNFHRLIIRISNYVFISSHTNTSLQADAKLALGNADNRCVVCSSYYPKGGRGNCMVGKSRKIEILQLKVN